MPLDQRNEKMINESHAFQEFNEKSSQLREERVTKTTKREFAAAALLMRKRKVETANDFPFCLVCVCVCALLILILIPIAIPLLLTLAAILTLESLLFTLYYLQQQLLDTTQH